jgi:cytochrome b subunit of formate dehydrogenase
VLERKFSLLYGPDSMVPRVQDVKDFFAMVKWFLYLGPRPKLDRWTYWEKFDYFAVFWGVPVIGLSGLMLWFPTFFAEFLPGDFLNIAHIVHGEEALLATAFIFAFHFFHNHLRPENFPMDTVIFTGKMTLARFKEERSVEYERLVSEGTLDTVLTDPPSRRVRIISKTFGFIAYISGVIMVVAIFITLLNRH